MPSVLVSSDKVNCAHSPGAATNVPAIKLTVHGKPVLTDLGPVTGCTNVPPPQSNTVCLAVTISGGKATKLKVGGTPVLLGTLSASAAGSPGSPSLSVTPGQTKLMAV